MKILSLNINNFAGRGVPKPSPKGSYTGFEFIREVRQWRGKPEHYVNADYVLSLISKESPDIVFLQEFDVTSSTSQRFIKNMIGLSYSVFYPDNNSEDSCKGHKSITIMFSKIPNIVVKSNSCLVSGSLKWVNVEVGDVLIAGVHFNYSMDYWNALEKFYSLNKGKKLLVIGDLNVCIPGTDRRARFDKLLSMGIVDIGMCDNTPTFVNGARLDYVLTSESVKDRVSLKVDSSPIKEGFSDHSSLIVSYND